MMRPSYPYTADNEDKIQEFYETYSFVSSERFEGSFGGGYTVYKFSRKHTPNSKPWVVTGESFTNARTDNLRKRDVILYNCNKWDRPIRDYYEAKSRDASLDRAIKRFE